jgi:hypothetical protein
MQRILKKKILAAIAALPQLPVRLWPMLNKRLRSTTCSDVQILFLLLFVNFSNNLFNKSEQLSL